MAVPLLFTVRCVRILVALVPAMLKVPETTFVLPTVVDGLSMVPPVQLKTPAGLPVAVKIPLPVSVPALRFTLMLVALALKAAAPPPMLVVPETV